jgi:hypothetical protein
VSSKKDLLKNYSMKLLPIVDWYWETI